MSCKYCELKRRKDDDVEWVAGEDWESDSDDGGYICPNDDGFRMLVYYDARCACTAVDNIKYCPFCGAKLAMPKEPLIKDEKIRKAVRAWYELFDENRLGQFEDGKYIAVGYREFVLQTLDTSLTYTFELPFIDGMQSLKQRWGLGADYYTLTELCGGEKE